MSLFDCEAKCRQNCSCIAFASVYNNGTGCEIFNKDIWFIPPESSNFHTGERMVYFLEKGRGLPIKLVYLDSCFLLLLDYKILNSNIFSAATQWWIWLIDAAGGTFLVFSIFFCVIWIKRKGEN